MTKFTRRRFITLTAATSALALTGGMSRPAEALSWQGIALGANASLTLMVDDRTYGRKVLQDAIAELYRLEKIFSIFEPHSEISRLNRAGSLTAPSYEFLALLSLVDSIHQRTNGLFDPTVQSLYQLYRQHAGRPPRDRVDQALRSIGFEKVSIRASGIVFQESGMAMTLNGIAQGFITDKIAADLKRAGFRNILLNLGEIRAEGRRDSHQPWQVAIADPHDGNRAVFETALENRAVATSEAAGLNFLLDPRSGQSADHGASLSVFANSAALADGLSTALSLTTWVEAKRIAASFPDIAMVARDCPGHFARFNI
jgi:thiamine biosynthesis lipoprotein